MSEEVGGTKCRSGSRRAELDDEQRRGDLNDAVQHAHWLDSSGTISSELSVEVKRCGKAKLKALKEKKGKQKKNRKGEGGLKDSLGLQGCQHQNFTKGGGGPLHSFIHSLTQIMYCSLRDWGPFNNFKRVVKHLQSPF